MSDTKMRRRIQVFIGAEASRALDEIMELTGSTQTEAIEVALIGRSTEVVCKRNSSLTVETVANAHEILVEAQRKLEQRRAEPVVETLEEGRISGKPPIDINEQLAGRPIHVDGVDATVQPYRGKSGDLDRPRVAFPKPGAKK